MTQPDKGGFCMFTGQKLGTLCQELYQIEIHISFLQVRIFRLQFKNDSHLPKRLRSMQCPGMEKAMTFFGQYLVVLPLLSVRNKPTLLFYQIEP